MNIIIYIITAVLFAVLLFWTWNNEKNFETSSEKIIFMIIGLIALGIITFIIFNISKSGIEYPNNEILNEVRKIALLIFIPINGYLSLPHIANLKYEIDEGIDDEKTKRKIIILGIVIIVAIIIEIAYLKDFQNGIINMLNAQKK